jgi:hypothetical protein
MTTAAPPRIVSKCPVCRLYAPPTRDPDWHLSTNSHQANVREPERRVRAGTRAERGSER